jgi:hypothetical protein
MILGGRGLKEGMSLVFRVGRVDEGGNMKGGGIDSSGGLFFTF